MGICFLVATQFEYLSEARKALRLRPGLLKSCSVRSSVRFLKALGLKPGRYLFFKASEDWKHKKIPTGWLWGIFCRCMGLLTARFQWGIRTLALASTYGSDTRVQGL